MMSEDQKSVLWYAYVGVLSLHNDAPVNEVADALMETFTEFTLIEPKQFSPEDYPVTVEDLEFIHRVFDELAVDVDKKHPFRERYEEMERKLRKTLETIHQTRGS